MRLPCVKACWLALVLTILSGCSFTPKYGLVEGDIQRGGYSGAAAALESSEKNYGSNSRLLYYFDRAMALHLAGQYADSNKVLDQANQLANDLYTTSVSREALSLVGNDNALDYEGED